MADSFEFDLGELGGSWRFRTWHDAIAWVAAEQDRWAWLADAPSADRWGMVSLFGQRLSWLRNTFQNQRDAGSSLGGAMAAIQQVYVTGPELVLHSEGDKGRRVQELAASVGPAAGLVASACALYRAQPTQLNSIDEFRAAVMFAVPTTMKGDAIASELQRERRNLRDRADRLLNSLESEELERRERFLRR